MSPDILLAMATLIIQGGVLGFPTAEECCHSKTVGGLDYKLLLHLQEKLDPSCSTGCIYRLDGDVAVPSLFCFSQGDLPVVCKDEMSSPSTTEGILITGGGYDGTTTEVYLPSSNTSCQLQDLPDRRYYHTQTTLADNSAVICGTNKNPKSCLKLSPTSASGVWSEYATLVHGRVSSTSWLSSEGLIIISGSVDPESSTTTEKVPDGGLQFSVGKRVGACAIADQKTDSVILTGGLYTEKNVDRYNLQGHVESLPDIQARFYHACGSFMSGGNMVLVVAGGVRSGGYLTSTEKMTIGQSAWTVSANLPRALYGMPSISFDNKVIIFGGYDGVNRRTEILDFNGENWKVTGHMKTARRFHAASLITIPSIICG